MKLKIKNRKRAIADVLFVISLFVFLGCVKSQKGAKPDLKIINVAGIARFTYSDSLIVNPNVEFKLLVDEEYKKKLPGTFDYDAYKPDFIFVSKNLNLKDTIALKNFSGIAINLENKQTGSEIYLGDEVRIALLESILRNIKNSSYRIDDWKKINSFVANDSTNAFFVSYRQINDENRALNVDETYLFRKGKVLRITLTASDADYVKWKAYYDEMIKSVVFSIYKE